MIAPARGDDLAAELAIAKVVLILRDRSPEDALQLVARAVDAGVRCVEITIETRRGRDALEAVCERFARTPLLVAAGTVRTTDDVRFARAAGARFTLSPGHADDVVSFSNRVELPHVPGVATPTEVLSAVRGGTTLLKAFPASLLGPRWLAAMRGPFPEVQFIATGGVSARSAQSYLDGGSNAVGITAQGQGDQEFRALREAHLLKTPFDAGRSPRS